jgi:hypothetical protein
LTPDGFLAFLLFSEFGLALPVRSERMEALSFELHILVSITRRVLCNPLAVPPPVFPSHFCNLSAVSGRDEKCGGVYWAILAWPCELAPAPDVLPGFCGTQCP